MYLIVTYLFTDLIVISYLLHDINLLPLPETFSSSLSDSIVSPTPTDTPVATPGK